MKTLRRLALLSFLFLSFVVVAGPGDKTPEKTKGSLLELDVSGANGLNGLPGYSYRTGANNNVSGTGFFYNSMVADAMGSFGDVFALVSGGGGSGKNGNRGGNAGPSTAGQNAGNITVQLSSGNNEGKLNGVVMITASLLQPASNQSVTQNYQIHYGTSGFIYAWAKGGKGGNGGVAGDGQGGTQGDRGRDASRHVWGGDGGRGGDGGDGGNGTPGAQGGDGGIIQVQVPEKDLGLLMLMNPDVSKGPGGDAGANGQGGSGGAGGPGGSSAMGSDTHYRTVTDSEGNTSTESYEEPWFTPGGSDGSRGNNGRTGSGNISAGLPGKDGKIQYIVVKEDGTTLVSERIFDLRLDYFDFEGMDNNGVLEPGEIITVKNMRVRNDGGLPTPAYQKTKIFISNNEWVMTDGIEVYIPKSLAPGETYILPESFTFTINSTQIEKEGVRFVDKGQIQPLSYVTQVERQFPNFNLVKDFQITFPVEITGITGLRSLAPGESTQIRFKVTNISNSDMGRGSELNVWSKLQFEVSVEI